MSIRRRISMVCAALGTLGIVLWQTAGTNDSVFDERDVLRCDADQLKATLVAPCLEVPLRPGVSVLWCGTFQLAWNEACSLVGEDLRFAGQEPDMVRMLNKKSFTKADLDEAGYVAVADFVGNGVFATIRRELQRKFAAGAAPRLIPSASDAPRPQDIVSYAYLFKNLPFAAPFERLDEPLRFGAAKIRCFGIGKEPKSDHASLYPQVRVLDFVGRDDFVIELKTKAAQDRLILAKVSPEATLQATVVRVQSRVADARPTQAVAGDVLMVPRLNFDITRRYAELERALLAPKNPHVAKDLVLLSAVQNTRFQMDEKGVRLRSEAHLVFGCSAPRRPPTNRVMVFDKPFLIMLQRVDARMPYFALWVGNPEILVASTE